MCIKITKVGNRSLQQISREIRNDWKKVNYAAVPYLDALSQLNDISDNYYQDSAASVVRYFLANATTWRGDVARRIKAELNTMIKNKY